MSSVYAVYGASGFGREVAPLARDHIASLVDDVQLVFVDDFSPNDQINGLGVLSLEQFLASENTQKYVSVAIADSAVREKIFSICESEGMILSTIVAKNSVILDDVFIGLGSIVCPFSTITSNVRIGKGFHCNIYSYVAHDCRIGDFVTFAPRVMCNGNVIVEDHAYIGTGAIIKQGTTDSPTVIGSGAVVGMGAVVTKSVPPNVTVVGNPARILEKK